MITENGEHNSKELILAAHGVPEFDPGQQDYTITPAPDYSHFFLHRSFKS